MSQRLQCSTESCQCRKRTSDGQRWYRDRDAEPRACVCVRLKAARCGSLSTICLEGSVEVKKLWWNIFLSTISHLKANLEKLNQVN